MRAPRPIRVISGGQTGADRAGLDAALALGIAHGGAVPRGRRAEDGRVADRYRLDELDSPDYAARTERNVRDADATVVFARTPATGGSALTLELARRLGKPTLHLDPWSEGAAAALAGWLAGVRPAVLNVAGSRESHAPGIHARVQHLLVELWS